MLRIFRGAVSMSSPARAAASISVIAAAAAMGWGGEALAEVADGSANVAEVQVTAPRKPPLERDTGAPTMPYSVQDTPQAITVIPETQLRQQGVATLDQALRNVPGITVAIGE